MHLEHLPKIFVIHLTVGPGADDDASQVEQLDILLHAVMGGFGIINNAVTPVAVRIKKLEKAGYILRYVAILDREKIHRGLIAFTGIQLGAHSQAALRGFEKSVARIPEVMECYRLTGKLDFLAKIAVRDMSEYNSFLIDKLSTLPDVVSVETHFVLSDIKADTAYPLREVGVVSGRH